MNPADLTALLHLASPALPIGGFSYSQGFESAVSEGLIKNEVEASVWLSSVMREPLTCCEAPLWVLLFDAWQQSELDNVHRWNHWFWASRETQEFRSETEQMGWSLIKLSQQLEWDDPQDSAYLKSIHPVTYPCAHAYVCVRRSIPLTLGLTVYVYSWLENQVMAAIKSIPLGQTAGQKILQEMASHIPFVVEEAISRARHLPPQLNTFSHQLAVLSSRHESQYSRLFRS